MSSVKVRATIVEDNTGIKSQLPILLTEQGELSTVTDYLLKLEADGVSNSVMNGFIQAVSLLLDYMEANRGLFYFTIMSLKYPFGRVMVSRSETISLLSLQGQKSVHTIIHGMYAYEFHKKHCY